MGTRSPITWHQLHVHMRHHPIAAISFALMKHVTNTLSPLSTPIHLHTTKPPFVSLFPNPLLMLCMLLRSSAPVKVDSYFIAFGTIEEIQVYIIGHRDALFAVPFLFYGAFEAMACRYHSRSRLEEETQECEKN